MISNELISNGFRLIITTLVTLRLDRKVHESLGLATTRPEPDDLLPVYGAAPHTAENFRSWGDQDIEAPVELIFSFQRGDAPAVPLAQATHGRHPAVLNNYLIIISISLLLGNRFLMSTGEILAWLQLIFTSRFGGISTYERRCFPEVSLSDLIFWFAFCCALLTRRFGWSEIQYRVLPGGRMEKINVKEKLAI